MSNFDKMTLAEEREIASSWPDYYADLLPVECTILNRGATLGMIGIEPGIVICGSVILFGGIAKLLAWAGLLWGVYTLTKAED